MKVLKLEKDDPDCLLPQSPCSAVSMRRCRRIFEGTNADSTDTSADEKALALDRRRWTPSLLTRLDGLAVRPDVDDQRVAYLDGTNNGSPSKMTMDELHAMANFYPWPKGVKLRLPCVDGGSLANYPGCIVVFKEFMSAGFRLPLHPFICDFLSDTKLCPAQLTPNAWRSILAFLLKFKELNLEPSYEAFECMYGYRLQNGYYSIFFKGVNLISNLSSPHNWVKKWFLVCQSEEFHFNFPIYPGYPQFCRGSITKQKRQIDKEVEDLIEFFKNLPRDTGLLNYKKVLDGCRLEEAGLSLPHPVKGQAGLSDMSVEHITRRKRAKWKSMYVRSKKAKTYLSQFKDIVSTKSKEDEEELEEEEDEEEDPEEEDEEQHDDDEEPEEENEEVDDNDYYVAEEEILEEEAPCSSAHDDGEKEMLDEGGFDVSLEKKINSIGTLCRPEVLTALRQLPEILLAAKGSEVLELQLNESIREIVELKRENTEHITRVRKLNEELARKDKEIERLQLEKKNAEEELTEIQSKFMEVTQKAKECVEISSSIMKVKLPNKGN